MTFDFDQVIAILEEEASRYSYKEEVIRPSIVAAIFVNAVRSKLEIKGGFMIQPPSIGRIVHAYGQPMNQQEGAPPHGPEAAVVVGLHEEEGLVDLVVLQSNGIFHQNRVKFSPEPKAYCWSWPPRVV